MKRTDSKRGIDFKKVIFSISLPILKSNPEYRIFLDWDKIVGEYFASISRPYKISGKILWLYVRYGASLEVQYAEQNILKKVNTYLGVDLFDKLKIRQEGNNCEKIEKNNNIFTKIVFNIGDDGVEQQLNRLWSSMSDN